MRSVDFFQILLFSLLFNSADGRAIRFRCGFQNTIFDVLKSRSGWVESPRLVEVRKECIKYNQILSMNGLQSSLATC